MLGQPGDGERPGNRAEGNDQLVVLQLELLVVDPIDRERAAGGIGAGDGADHEIGLAELRAQRDDDMARVEGRAGGSGEQGRVEHEVGLVYERHVGALRGQQALECAGSVETAKAAPGDHDFPSHRTE